MLAKSLFDSSAYLVHCAEDEAVTFCFEGYDHRQHGELVEVVFDRKVTTKLFMYLSSNYYKRNEFKIKMTIVHVITVERLGQETN